MSALVLLQEDVPASLDRIQQEIESQMGVPLDRSRFEDEFAQQVGKLRGTFEALRRSVYSELLIEAADPHYSPHYHEFNPGGWVGTFRFDLDSLGQPIRVQVLPKVGTQAFSLMVNEITELVPVIGLPAMDVVFRNVFGDTSITRLVTYSNLVRELTELALAEGLPRTTIQRRFQAPNAMGTIDVPRTANLLRRGLQLVSSSREVISLADLPRLVLAQFHARLLSGLVGLRRETGAVAEAWLGDPFRRLENYHRFVLLDDDFFELLDGAVKEDLGTPEVLSEARKLAGRNESLAQAIDAYEHFLQDLRWGELTFGQAKDLLPLQPVPGSKVYELWILRLILDSIGQLSGLHRPRLQKLAMTRTGLQLSFGHVELAYNCSVERWSKILRQLGLTARPDYLINPGRGMAAVDAKYKSFHNLSPSDMERLLAYLLDFSEPQNATEVKAFLVLLNHLEPWSAFEREDLVPPARVFTLEASPEQPREARENIGWMCAKVLRQRG